MSEYHVLIPCAGHGSRMQTAVPKQYLPLLGKPVLRHAIDVFESVPDIQSVTVVIAPNDSEWQPPLIDGCHKTRVLACGGASRAESVLNGLQQMSIAANDWVLVHDAARPGIDATLLARLMAEASDSASGGLLALPLADTLKRADAQSCVTDTLPRSGLWQAQTPQMFRYASLTQALQTHLQRQPTDEAQAMEWMGHQPKLVLGDLKNLKITYPHDLQVVAALMLAAQTPQY